jgi:hypothetical protein
MFQGNKAEEKKFIEELNLSDDDLPWSELMNTSPSFGVHGQIRRRFHCHPRSGAMSLSRTFGSMMGGSGNLFKKVCADMVARTGKRRLAVDDRDPTGDESFINYYRVNPEFTTPSRRGYKVSFRRAHVLIARRLRAAQALRQAPVSQVPEPADELQVQA